MTTGIVNDIAQHIRFVDGGNRMPARDVGIEVGRFVETDGCQGCVDLVADFVARTNPDKRMGAGALAELIVAEFNLDEAVAS